MKEKKTAGIDEILMEAWRYGGKWVKQGLRDLVKQIWNKDGIPEDWKLGIIVPIYKKRDRDKTTEEYHCYARFTRFIEIIRGRLKREGREIATEKSKRI